MFDETHYWKVESHFTQWLSAMEARREAARPVGFRVIPSIADVWEKCEDVARRVALLSDTELPSCLFGTYDVGSEDSSASKPLAFSNLFLALAHVLCYQPDRKMEDMGLFEGTLALECLLLENETERDFLSRRWPPGPLQQYAQIRKYRLENDPLARLAVLTLPDPCAQEESLYSAFCDNFVFMDDLDDEYELYIRLFCRLTLELASYCKSFCEAMATWIGEGSGTVSDGAPTAAEIQTVARVALYARAIAAFGLRFGYSQWLETLDSRLVYGSE